jgi:hypothetical protein
LKEVVQAQYEQRLSRYAALIHGNEPPGLVAKLAIYSAMLDQETIWSDRLWKIEPLLYPLIQSVEIDLHLATARLLERPSRSDRSLFRFLEFCRANRMLITGLHGALPADLLQAQIDQLEAHRPTIDAMMGRRDKFFAHLDKKYFDGAASIYGDFPLLQPDVIALVNTVVGIVSAHQRLLSGQMNFHLAEFYRVAVDNMVRNLTVGRSTNFPGQLD